MEVFILYRFKSISNGLLAALILSVIIAFMISLIPNNHFFGLNNGFPVFKQDKQVFLSENNIVDFIASFPLEMQIRRVTWEHNTLSIDFAIEESIDTNLIYKDLFTVIKQSLVQGSNVKEVLLRVFLKDMDKIFVAVSAKQKDLLNNPSMEIDSNMRYKDFLDKYFGLNFGNLIRQE